MINLKALESSAKKKLEDLKKQMSVKLGEFKPLLNKEQQEVYLKHLEMVYNRGVEDVGNSMTELMGGLGGIFK